MAQNAQNLLKLDSGSWFDQLAKLMLAQNTPEFPDVLLETLKCIVPFDHSVIFGYHGQERPICLFDTFPPHKRIVMVSVYQEGPFLLDPFYIACLERAKPGLYRLRDIAPDRFYHSEYYRSYYRRTVLSEEISFIIALPENVGLSISLMRAVTSPIFSERDINKLRRIESVIQATASRHWHAIGEPEIQIDLTTPPQPVMKFHVTSAFEKFGEGVLTKREREVVRMVLRGHSSESIGKHFQITTGTVKIHRKNIYSKLSISSQSELFSHFISFLSGMVEPSETAVNLNDIQDPLQHQAI